MTTPGEGGRPGWAAMWLAHYNAPFLVAFAGTSMVFDAYHALWVAWVSTGLFVVWFAALILHLRCHYGHLCERCIGESPLDPQTAVQRWMPALWYLHHKAVMVPVQALALAAIVASPFLGPWEWPVDALALLAVIFGWVTQSQHGRLQAWCPWCHWGGRGDDEELAPQPAPEAGVR